jgi:hypothetical protein
MYSLPEIAEVAIVDMEPVPAGGTSPVAKSKEKM